MKRNHPRTVSPTPTAFSGISNYRTTDSHRRDTRGVPPVPNFDYRSVSKEHYNELGKYLANYLEKAPPNSRSTARSKLTRLTIQQFHELSTDVFDELLRRKNENQVPFLPVREEFHPKRNQARQKLATLPITRFEDLSSDVYYELARRYPEFQEDPLDGRGSTTSNYDDYPAPDFPSNNAAQRNDSRISGRQSADRPSDSGYGGSVSGRRPSGDRRRPSETEFSGRRSEESFRRQEDIFPTRDEGFSAALASRRKPSQDSTTTRRFDDLDREFVRRPTQSSRNTPDSTSTVNQHPTQSTTAMIVPTKSTIEEEYIDIPYGRDGRDSGLEERHGGTVDEGHESTSDYPIPLGVRSPPAGLGGLTSRLKGVDDDDIPGSRSGDDPFEKIVRPTTESRSPALNISSRITGPSVTEAAQKMKSEYEYVIATMQMQISNLQRDLTNATEAEKSYKDSEKRVRQLEEELSGFRQRAEEQSATIRTLQMELEDHRTTRELAARQADEDREELNTFRDRCNKLEEEFSIQQSMADSDTVEQLRADMEGLLAEVSELSRRNDELMNAKDVDTTVIRDFDNQLKEYKRKYELAKTELRSVKVTSQLFLQAPKLTEDQLPVTAEGGILDIHVTAFLSAIDSLLTAGRASAPTRVLTPMKSVVNSVTNILDDVKAFERRSPRDRGDVETDALSSLRERAEATLSNLAAASKTHASSAGMSPVSLLDAAASHVSATITEIGRMIFIRKATKSEQEQASYGYIVPTAPNGHHSPSLRSIGEISGHQRKGSLTSISSRGGSRFSDSPSSTSANNRSYTDTRRRTPSDHSSSEQMSSPPPIFDTQGNSAGMVSDDSAQAEGSEDAWAEVKPYLEAQTESIVYAIQSVLSGVRSPTPSATLNENLTQIITIVSSIVAVCKDNLPPASAQQGNEVLHELDDHANKLSEVQALPEVTKEARRTMANSSFAIANAMKGLMKL